MSSICFIKTIFCNKRKRSQVHLPSLWVELCTTRTRQSENGRVTCQRQLGKDSLFYQSIYLRDVLSKLAMTYNWIPSVTSSNPTGSALVVSGTMTWDAVCEKSWQ